MCLYAVSSSFALSLGGWTDERLTAGIVFMQDPLFDAADDGEPGENAQHLVDALSAFCPSPPSSSSSVRPYIDPNAQLISAIGSAPYVERTRAQQLANIAYIVALAQRYSLHVDFHLDYDLRPLEGEGAGDGPLIWAVLEQLNNAARARTLHERTVVAIGHATRLTRFPTAKLLELRARIDALPYAVHFIGLPQSDMYMMGRRPVSVAQAHTNATEEDAYDAPRGTLNAVRLRTALGFGSVALAVNNVGNAFTPQGAPDPLALCPLGVAVYQDGTPGSCAALLVSKITQFFSFDFDFFPFFCIYVGLGPPFVLKKFDGGDDG